MVAPLSCLAADRACTIEGSFVIMGQTIDSKDCMQADPKESDAAFKRSCDQLAETSAMLSAAPGKIAYTQSCPKPAQGVCKGFLGGKRDAYYYARSPSDLKDLPASCATSGGRWQGS